MASSMSIDVHVLTLPHERKDWLAQCLESLRSPSCTVHVVDGIEGHIGLGRKAGYSMGHAPFVSYVDADDWVNAKWYGVAIQAIGLGAGVFCREQRISVVGAPLGPPVLGSFGHHGFVYRREAIQPFLAEAEQWPVLFDKYLAARLRPEPIDFTGYYWREHANGCHHGIPNHPRYQELIARVLEARRGG